MSKTVVITQSNYIPWRGYFDLFRSADEVVILDSVQYTRRDWRNRNKIKGPEGEMWLTIPVEVKGQYFQSIDETKIAAPDWVVKHKRSIEAAYRRAPCFEEIAPWLFGLMDSVADERLLSKVNERLLRGLSDRLGIRVPMRRCTDVIPRDLLKNMDPTERLIALASALSATHYLSGPAARAYLDVDRFSRRGIKVIWMTYPDYPEYPQLWGPFEPRVSVVDLLLNVGLSAERYLKSPLS